MTHNGLVVMGMATEGYVSPCHINPNDPRFTVGLRAWRAGYVSKWAYQFVFPARGPSNLQTACQGIIVLQPRGTLIFWQAETELHGSSADKVMSFLNLNSCTMLSDFTLDLAYGKCA